MNEKRKKAVPEVVPFDSLPAELRAEVWKDRFFEYGWHLQSCPQFLNRPDPARVVTLICFGPCDCGFAGYIESISD
jgi:hypothetical protein